MRKLLLCVLMLSSLFVCGQNKQLLYNFDMLPQNLMSNPGAEPTFNMHIGIPLLSQFHISAGSSGVTLYDIFQEGEPGSINNRIKSSLAEMGNREFFTVNEQWELLYAGFQDNSGNYWSAGVYQELDAFLMFPKDLAILGFEGNAGYRNKSFSFTDVAFTGEILNVFHIGISRRHSEDLTYGIRGKLYSSAMNIRSVNNDGEFRNISEDGDSFRPAVIDFDGAIRTAGLASVSDMELTYKNIKNVALKRLLFGGDFGLGLDLGFTYYLEDQWRLTGSILDLGIIAHTKDVENYTYQGDYRSASVDLEYLGPNTDPLENLEEISGDLEVEDETNYENYFSTRPVKLNASLDYGFGEIFVPCNYRVERGRRRYYNYVGLHLFTMKRPQNLVSAATLYYDRKIAEGLRGKVTYTVDSFSYSNIGLLLSADIGAVNLYAAADNLLSYYNLAKSHTASLQLGIQFVFDGE